MKPFDVRTLNRYWNDPAFAAEIDAERNAMRAIGNAAWTAAMRRNHPHIEPSPEAEAAERDDARFNETNASEEMQ